MQKWFVCYRCLLLYKNAHTSVSHTDTVKLCHFAYFRTQFSSFSTSSFNLYIITALESEVTCVCNSGFFRFASHIERWCNLDIITAVLGRLLF